MIFYGKHTRLKMKIINVISVILLCTYASNSFSGGKDYWKTNHFTIIGNEFICKPTDPVNDKSPCNYLLSNVLEKGWGLTEFKTPSGYLSANSIFKLLEERSDWIKLGAADKQGALNVAQTLANKGFPVIAASEGAVHGHVALIIPGEESMSGKWGLDVPNSASFFLGRPHKSYIGKMLSFAWSSDQKSNVVIFFKAEVPD